MSMLYCADINEDEWEVVRAMAEEAIGRNEFNSDPIKCVVNAYITYLMLMDGKGKPLDADQVH